jgi:hypothetical protein
MNGEGSEVRLTSRTSTAAGERLSRSNVAARRAVDGAAQSRRKPPFLA